ncbi:hypothetical protein JOE11_002241 [Robbsia andropogonis]
MGPDRKRGDLLSACGAAGIAQSAAPSTIDSGEFSMKLGLTLR